MLNKKETHKIIFKATEDCKDKTVEEMQGLINENNTSLYNSIVEQIITNRTQELSYTDGTGAIYL